jgi:hypothetical protein
MATAMVGDLGGAGDSLNRLHEMVEDEREKAAARARVAGGGVDASELEIEEAEQDALADQALEDFLSDEEPDDPGPPLSLPDFSDEREAAPVPRSRKNDKEK